MGVKSASSVSKVGLGRKTGRKPGTPKTGGRKKGTPNKTTALLKDAILKAAEEAGGEHGLIGYLHVQAVNNPQSFLPLLGKVLPLQVTGEDGGPVQTETRLDVTALSTAALQEIARLAPDA